MPLFENAHLVVGQHPFDCIQLVRRVPARLKKFDPVNPILRLVAGKTDMNVRALSKVGGIHAQLILSNSQEGHGTGLFR